eukprot:gene10681-biopygen4694
MFQRGSTISQGELTIARVLRTYIRAPSLQVSVFDPDELVAGRGSPGREMSVIKSHQKRWLLALGIPRRELTISRRKRGVFRKKIDHLTGGPVRQQQERIRQAVAQKRKDAASSAVRPAAEAAAPRRTVDAAGGAERRIDDADGKAYTKQEFIDEYGDTDRWANAQADPALLYAARAVRCTAADPTKATRVVALAPPGERHAGSPGISHSGGEGGDDTAHFLGLLSCKDSSEA